MQCITAAHNEAVFSIQECSKTKIKVITLTMQSHVITTR